MLLSIKKLLIHNFIHLGTSGLPEKKIATQSSSEGLFGRSSDAGDNGGLLRVSPQCLVLRVGSRTLLTPKHLLESFAELFFVARRLFVISIIIGKKQNFYPLWVCSLGAALKVQQHGVAGTFSMHVPFLLLIGFLSLIPQVGLTGENFENFKIIGKKIKRIKRVQNYSPFGRRGGGSFYPFSLQWEALGKTKCFILTWSNY